MSTAIRIAVVGHTNTGKTSLLRTLIRDAAFGEVADGPGTTRRVEGARLDLDGSPAVAWFDTPGLEDSMALLDYIDVLTGTERLDGPARIGRFLAAPGARDRYEQEARVLDKLLQVDAALYVIDARDPVLPKHRDELALLAACGRPLLPVLNFLQAPAHCVAAWREALARQGLHVVAEFDSVAPALDGERQLYDRLALLLHDHADRLKSLAHSLGAQRAARYRQACELLADMLVDCAALHLVSPPDETAVAAAVADLQTRVRQREAAGVAALLVLYRFPNEAYTAGELPLTGARWELDLFHPQALKDVGIQVGAGMAAGAMAGAAVDLMTAGLSLGTGTLVGAAAGGLWQGAQRMGRRVAGRLRGWRESSIDDAVLRLLAVRGRALIAALQTRGHAATQAVSVQGAADPAWQTGEIPAALSEARSRPDWSSLDKRFEDDARRRAVVAELALVLAR
ncbi:MAG: GTPase/DUF3482 domain-containing protein [Burkholderiaceae bacterium]|nr:GTPase/DUF3482 domain-containing protein [Burkholderiaceae bacterium]